MIFLILKHYKILQNKSILETIDKFIESNLIHVAFHVSDYEKKDFTLDFNDIKNDFFDYFFNQELDNRHLGGILDLMQFYSVTIKDIKEVSLEYLLEDYKDYYLYFRSRINNIDDLLMKNSEFKVYMEDLWAKNKEQEKQWRDKRWEKEESKKKKQQQEIYEGAINSLSTQNDILNVYLIAKSRKRDKKTTYDILIEDLGDKYWLFIDLTKKEFQHDSLYLTIKEKFSAHTIYYFTMLYDYLFSNISNEEIDELIHSEEEYKKLFWHALSYTKLSKEYFLYISKKNISNLILLSIEVLNFSLSSSKYTKSAVDSEFIHIYKKLEIFDKENLQYLIEEIKKNLSSHVATLNEESKDYFIQIIATNSHNYEFIKELAIKDIENFTIYFEYLFILNNNRAFNDFIELIYPRGNSHLSFSTSAKANFLKPIYQFNKFDVLTVSSNHRQQFRNLMRILHGTSKLTDENLKFILENYFDFFHEYYHPKGSDSPDVYDDMNNIISNILNNLGEDTTKINLLEELKNSPNIPLQTRIKRQLGIAYNLQLKNREDDKDYKNILDEFVSGESDNRFFDYEKLKNDLIEISLILMESRKSIFNEIEDLVNDRFRDALKLKSYRIADQSRGGESQSGKSVGERDLVVQNNESGVAESGIEAFVLESDTASTINEHYDKLINKYDTSGNRSNFILVYSKVKDFEVLWNKYQKRFLDFTIEDVQKDNLKVGFTKKGEMQIAHLFINFYSD